MTKSTVNKSNLILIVEGNFHIVLHTLVNEKEVLKRHILSLTMILEVVTLHLYIQPVFVHILHQNDSRDIRIQYREVYIDYEVYLVESKLNSYRTYLFKTYTNYAYALVLPPDLIPGFNPK